MPDSSFVMSDQSAAAGEVCGLFHRAYRDRRLYPPGHPTAGESTEAFAEAVSGFVERWGVLDLEVREDALALYDEAVYQREASRDNLAFLMFRDGLRTLSVHPDCDPSELDALVDCLAHADDLAVMEHDLVTALWEQDFSHIEYHVVDPFLAGDAVPEGLVDTLRETVAQRVGAVRTQDISPQSLAEDRMRRVRARRYEDASLRLTPEEIEYGERAVEGLSSLTRDFGEVLLEIAGKIPVEAIGDVVIQSLASALGAFLDEDDLDGAMLLLERLGRLEDVRWCPSGSVGFVAGEAVTADRLRDLLGRAKQGEPERFERMRELLLLVRRWITLPLLEILTEAGERNVRKTVLDVLGDENAVPWRDLEPLLRDPRWYVVRNAVQLAAQMGHEELADHSGRLLAHQDVRVRREMVRALGRLNSATTRRGLRQALSDQDPSVRTLAAHALSRKGGAEEDRTLLLAHIKDRTFASLSPEEMEAFLGAYAELTQERSIPLLEKFWKKSLFSAKPLALRVAAVLALGRVRGQAGAIALKAAAGSGEPPIRRAAADAVHPAATRPAGDEYR